MRLEPAIILTCLMVTTTSAAARMPQVLHGWVLKSVNAETKTRKFQSADGRAQLTVIQSHASRNLTKDMDEIAYHRGERITYQRRGRSWIAVSGYRNRNGMIFYRKSNLACRGSRWHSIEFIYPASDKRQMDRAVIGTARALASYSNHC